jgi:predicted RNase H-like HicB family nuclease
MRIEPVEIYSDATNAVIIRHPERNFPGVLIQGDTLHSLRNMAATALASTEPGTEHWHDLKELADDLQSRINFYSQVMREHGLQLPFFDGSF